MSRWINVVLVYVLLGAILLLLARALLPVIWLGGIAGGLIQPLVRLTPILMGVSLAALTLITFNLKRQTRLAKKWVEEAENWGNDLITGDDIKPSGPKTSLKMEGLPEGSINQQADERNVAVNGRSVAQAPAFTAAPEGEGLEMAAAAATAVLDRSRVERRPVKAEIAREFSEDR